MPVSLLNGSASTPVASLPDAVPADGSPNEAAAPDVEHEDATGEAEAPEPPSHAVEQEGVNAATPQAAAESIPQVGRAARYLTSQSALLLFETS